jgi:hypothetical protein
MKNWRTTVIGLATAMFGFVVFSPDIFAAWPWLIALAKYAMVGGLAGLGIVSRDANGAPSDKLMAVEAHLNAVDAQAQANKKAVS